MRLTRFLLLVGAVTSLATFPGRALGDDAKDALETLSFAGAETLTYKKTKEAELRLYVFSPAGIVDGDRRPAIVFFFGGGWRTGSPEQFEHQCRYFASRGMVAITAEYRVRDRHGTKAVSCVEDARSAIRWVRSNAARLRVDPKRVVAAGGSAGGHLAACVGLIDDFDAERENLAVSARPDALVLFNPAVVLAPAEKSTPGDRERLSKLAERLGTAPESLSPYHHVASGAPPTIVFHGTADTTVAFKTVAWFTDKMKAAGNRCELVPFEGKSHGFFNYGREGNHAFVETLERADRFLISLGYLKADRKKGDPPLGRPRVMTDSVGIELVFVPPGEFFMGSPEDEEGRADRERRHRVRLTKGFYMGSTEVTQKQWKALMGKNPSFFEGDSLPVETVTWKDAVEFCRKLSEKESARYRLPTEAEWEYACRAGTTTAFHTGVTISPEQANYNGNYRYGAGRKGAYVEQTSKAGSYPPNDWGLHDMHGNVWEWCADWYGEYPRGEVTDPAGPATGSKRICRGGCWINFPAVCRSANRGSTKPISWNFHFGFRVVRELD